MENEKVQSTQHATNPLPSVATPIIQPISQKQSQLPIILLSLLSLALLFGMVYFYLQTQAINKQLQSSIQSLDQPTLEPTPTTQQKIDYQDEAGPHILTYHDDICSVDISFPQFTEMNGQRFYWRVDASKTRTFIMDDRSESQSEPDQSIVIFTKPEGSNIPYYSSSVEIMCGQNYKNFSLDQYLQKTLSTQGLGGEIKYKVGSQRKFGNLTLTELKPEYGSSVYRGIYKNNLILVSNSNPGGYLQPIANTILDSINFK